MRIAKPTAVLLPCLFVAMALGQEMGSIGGVQPWRRTAGTIGVYDAGDAFKFDLTQHTCALYVAVRSAAFESPLEFGREVDDSMVHWNMCPGGKMLACSVTPTANGDTIVTGIPWSH